MWYLELLFDGAGGTVGKSCACSVVAGWVPCARLGLQGTNKAALGGHGWFSPWSLDLHACLNSFFFEEMHCWKSVYRNETTLSSILQQLPAVLQLRALLGRGGSSPIYSGLRWRNKSPPSLQLNVFVFLKKNKMLKMSFILEMEVYCCETLGMFACASICLAERWGKSSLPSC